MGAVEHTELHVLERLDVGRELRADLVPIRTALDEIVLDHPLAEGLADDTVGIVEAEAGPQQVAAFVGQGRHDAVDHRAGEGDIGLDPGGEIGIDLPGVGFHRLFAGFAVGRQVVERQDGEGVEPGFVAAAQRLDQSTDGAEGARAGWQNRG